MAPESFLTRWLDAVRPLPPTPAMDETHLAQRRRQRRLISYTLLLFGFGVAGYYIYDYSASAPIRARAAYDEGMKNMRPGTYADAIDLFTRSIDLSPAMPEAFLNRGIALHNMSQRNAALDDLARALEMDPPLTRAHEERGRIYVENRDLETALKEFSKSIALRPTTDGYYQRGLLYESLGQHQKAVDDYDKAIVEMPEAPFAYRARAAAKANLGDEAGAKLDRDAALRIERAR